LLFAALDRFPQTQQAVGIDINRRYVDAVNAAVTSRPDAGKVRIFHADFFHANWEELLGRLPQPVLIVGNPPWVTNAELGVLGSANLPEKRNFQKLSGLDALTGKSNFDISEWMLIRLAEWLHGRQGTMAMLCKTSVARKVLQHVWTRKLSLAQGELHLIDAAAQFGAAVDACLLVCMFAPGGQQHEAEVYGRLGDALVTRRLGYRDKRLVADVDGYERWKHLETGMESTHTWRSGIKHDCSRVMELSPFAGRYRNGLNEVVELEDVYLYPMLKSSELASGTPAKPRRWMLVTQRWVGEPTEQIKERAPKTWAYLQAHAARFQARASTIYRQRPAFAIFGVGEYSFAPHKVAISGFYKKLQFAAIGPFEGRPVVLDDTAYFLPCRTQAESAELTDLLNGAGPQEFFSSQIFWDSKRPITADLLRRLDLAAMVRDGQMQARQDNR
jgi:hypothetical protein